MKKRIIRVACAAIVLFAFFFVYQIGLLHSVAFKLAAAANIEWGVSSPQTIHFYFPRWVCGPGQPPYLLVETDDADYASAIGTHIRIGKDNSLEFNEYHFAECHGRFKTTLAMLIWEDRILRMEGWCDEGQSVTGRFFDAEFCVAATPTLEQTLKIEELMKSYTEPE